MASENSTAESCVVNDQMKPFAVLYTFIFLAGMAGSLVALWASLRRRVFKRCLNVYLVNLLVSDFLLMLALPVKITKDLGVHSQRLTVFHCQCSAVLIYINMYVSIIFLALVSVHRYLQVTQSSQLLRLQEVCFAVVMSAVVWVLVLFIKVPNMAIPIAENVPDTPALTCADLKQEVGRHWHTLSVFLGAAIFLNASVAVLLSNGLALRQLWGRRGADPERRAAVRHATFHIAAVTAAYVLCFVPYHAVRMPYTFTQTKVLVNDCPVRRRLFLAKEATLLLAILHLCFDPLLYFCLSSSSTVRVPETFSGHEQELHLQLQEPATSEPNTPNKEK
ncbi:probable G-protein coupled receptor 171 [Denticeps clupeoides]|uniref:probable G-protein coupled receptor 171 n=1 Tax=Denticeps clupeoides TaxID=299321 RepID=UPI0010A57C21|nr:probable G-protein coupled receptor 171 [Denticeps clupeoides]XP_028856002.1 probable G-protein coupled receptor 171 [Denticeps clupeoides]